MPIPKLVVTAALMVAQVAIGMSRKIKGPRLEDLSVTLADYGTPIPRFWGKRRFQPQIIWADKLQEEKKTSKTKGGKYSEYKYRGRWAVLICDQEIDSVSRIWFDKHLVYQVVEGGPISVVAGFFTEIFSRAQGQPIKLTSQNMRIYLGTETQTQDPLIEEWCEDRYGPDSCPAYRGSAYIVFEDIPLEKFGNRLPQITVEAIRDPTPNYPFETLTDGFGTFGAFFSPDRSRLVMLDGSQFQVWDVPTRTLIAERNGVTVNLHAAVRDDGSFYISSSAIYLVSEGGARTLVDADSTASGGLWIVSAGVYGAHSVSAGIVNVGGTDIAVSWRLTWCLDDTEGRSWAVGPGSGVVHFYELGAVVGDSFDVATGFSGDAYALDNGAGGFCIWQSDRLFIADKETGAVTHGPVSAPYLSAGSGGADDAIFRSTFPGQNFLWVGFTKFSTTDLSVLQSETASNWTGASTAGALYDPINDALWTKGTLESDVTIRYLNRVGSEGVTLGEVIDEVSEWVGLTTQDTSQLTQTVLGYSVTQGPAKDMIAPLLDIHDVDARPHDFTVQFVNRGSAPSGTILTPNFVREGDSARYVTAITQDTDLPRRLTFNFADNDHDQQPNTVIAQRPLDAVDSLREETIDLSTYADTPNSAQQKADRFFRRIWNSRERTHNALTAQKLALEPADVTTISLDGLLRNVRLDKMTITPTRIDCEWVRDETSFAAVNTATTGPEMEGRDPEEIIVPGPTKGFVIDGPYLDDSHNDLNPLLYIGAGSYGGTWTGGAIWRGDDGSYDELVAAVEPSNKAVWGYAATALPSANHNLWDRGNSVSVTVYGGTLTSVTEAEIDADPSLNLFAWGAEGRWEYINIATATLTGTQGNANVYTVSSFKRGRRGTEWAVELHEIGDMVVDVTNMIILPLGSDDIGDNLSFKAQTVGRDVEGAAAIDLTPFEAAVFKPYAPAVQKVTKDPVSGDITVDFDRRTRIGGNWNGSTIPLSEATEEYEMDVLDGVDVARTLTATTTSFTYSAANQVTDFGAEIDAEDLDAELFQLSAVVGRGYAATI